MNRKPILLALALAAFAGPAAAQTTDPARTAGECPTCTDWNARQSPFRIFGNTYYVGTRGLSAILITSDQGHVLIDGALPESAANIQASIRALGFRIEDVRLILNSHAHFDHAGGIAALQRASGAQVAATERSAAMLEAGAATRDDPQYGEVLSYPPVSNVRVIEDGDTLRVGPLALAAHLTAGHTPGSTTWTWRSCEGDRCLDMVYADSQTPVSADNFLFTRNTTYPSVVQDFERGHAVLERLPCDVLMTPHPGASRLFERASAGELIDPAACRNYAENARKQLAARIAREKGR